MAVPAHSERIAFGPFEMDAASGELLKHSVRVRLSSQRFRILLLLVNHSGEVISQERLKNEIWGDGVFVDFEHGLHAAINKLRQALGDSAENPRYIETVPGRGYRFIGVLERASQFTPVRTRKFLRRHRLAAIGTAAGIVFLVLTGVAAWSLARDSARSPKLTGKDTIVLADFDNKTGDPVFDEERSAWRSPRSFNNRPTSP